MAAAAVTAAISQSAPVTQMQNWMRLCLGSECYNKEAVRNVLHNKFNNPAYQGLPEDPVLLFQELKKNQPHLSKLKSKKRITKAQWKLLYPDTKQTHSREFDIPLMVILLEHCTDLDAPVNGWDDSTPPLTDQGLSANSLRARQMRHFLYHYGNPISMDKNEFLRKWTDLEDIQSGLGCATVDMLDLKTGPLDPHKLTYFKCAITYLEEGQKKLLGLHEGTASDVKMLIDEVSTLKESQKNFPDIDARVAKIISQYSDLYEQVQANKEMIKEHGANIQKNASRIQRNIESLEKHDIDIENLTTKVEDMKSHEDLLSSGMRWNIPENVSNFYGRTSVLDTVRRHFKNSSYERDYVAVVLSGLGGIGKTEVAVKYVSMYDKEYENVVWLECNDLKTSLMRLALYLEIERNVFEIDVLTQLICRKLKNSKCMFVLNDTVDCQSIKEFMKNLKNMKNTPCVLITSQYSEWDDARIKNIQMDVFESDEAVGFLCECFPKHDTMEVEMLARELQYLPLALQQARSYIKKHDRTIPDYIRYLADNRKELLNVRLDKTGVTEYDKTLLTVWKMAFDKLKEHDNSLAIDILNMMAYMDGRFINIKTFLYLDNIDEVELSEAVEVLCEYSLIQRNSSKSFSMHSLVQKITIFYDKIVPLSSEVNNSYFSKLSILLSDIAEKRPSLDHDPKNLWFRHLKKIMLNPTCKLHLPSVSKLANTAMASGDNYFYMYILSVFINYLKMSYHQSRKSEDFTNILFCAYSYAMALHKMNENALLFAENFSAEFEKELAKKTSNQLNWHYTHVMVLINNQKTKEAIHLFDSLPDVEISAQTFEYNRRKATILLKLGRNEDALCSNKRIFKWLISKDKLEENDSLHFTVISSNFVLLGDFKNACLCLTHAEELLRKLKVDMQSIHWYNWYYSKAVVNLYTHQYDKCIQELNRCLLCPCNTGYDIDVMIGYAELKQKSFENSKKKLTKLLNKPIRFKDRVPFACVLGAALLYLDEIDEAENVLKKFMEENYYNDKFPHKYLTIIDKYKTQKYTFNSYRKIYGEENSKTIEVLQECLRIRKQLKECYNEVPDLVIGAVFF